ncbi:MAG: alanine:cation symporter family protein [Lachnospiraceae bacterium]|nr:alanine:cation symporter family protein [Lachnospiraceae bacterium]
MSSFEQILGRIDGYVWGVPLMALILLGGLLLTIRTRALQVRRLPLALKWIFKEEEGAEGEVSSFAALMTALSATIGTGNIVGVATAVGTGGPGALFWMLVAAFFGMATKYSEGLLAVKYRQVDGDGHTLGGPFYYIEKGMGEKFRWLAKLFAFFGVCVGLFGIGTFSQVNGIVSAVNGFVDSKQVAKVTIPGLGEYTLVTVVASLILTLVVALVLIGGLKRIASVASFVVPFMAITYFVFAVLLILLNIRQVPGAIAQILIGAFHPRAVAGGAAGSILVAMQSGIARGIFSNEAGLGSAPIAAAAAKTQEPVRQGLVSMTGTFLDTIIVCNLTGIAIVLTGAWKVENLQGVQITTYAFMQGLPFPAKVSSFVLMTCLIFFAFTTILGWDYYSERCLEYVTGGRMKAVRLFRCLYILAVFIGPYMTVAAVWTIADIFNGLMAIPNMIAMFALSGVVAKETGAFFKANKHKKGKGKRSSSKDQAA